MKRWSLDDLFMILENLEFEMRFLTGLVYHLAKEADGMQGRHFRVLHSLDEIRTYAAEQICSYILVISPDQMLLGLNREGIEEVLRTGGMAAWFEGRWTKETLVIAVS